MGITGTPRWPSWNVSFDYCNQRINSERSLQASFWVQLNRTFPAGTRRMFIEPCLVVTVKRRRTLLYPDIVICRLNQAVPFESIAAHGQKTSGTAAANNA
jgi:hypothetical protein